MPRESFRGIRTSLLWVIAPMLCFPAGAACGQGSGPATVIVQVQLDDETQRLLSRAEALIGRGQNDAAFELLSKHEFDLAGNPLYDYLLGVAALDSGRYGEAIFSLQRALDVQPDFSGARLALARAHYEAGEKAPARALFLQLLDEQPPAAVRQTVEQYLAALDPRPRPKSRVTPFVEAVVGYDSNANASTDDQSFLGFMLSPSNVATSSPYAEFAAGIDWVRQDSQQSAWFARVRAEHRDNSDASFVNRSTASAQVAFTWRNGSFFGRAGLDGYVGDRDGHYNEKYGGANMEFGRRFVDGWDITANVRYGAQRYVKTIDILDINRLLYYVALRHSVMEGVSVRLDLIGGHDTEQEGGSPYGNSKSGGRFSFIAPMGDKVRASGSVGILETDYDGLFFGVRREDTQITATLQLEFRDVLSAGFTIIPRVLYVDNDSDISLYTYDRTEVGVLIRWSAK